MKRVLNQDDSSSFTVIDKLLVVDNQVEKNHGDRNQAMRSIIRDVYNLLNSRRYSFLMSEDYPNVTSSVLTYGLAGYSDFLAQEAVDETRLCNEIRWVIERFEPRLKEVFVRPLSLDRGDLIASFEINAYVDIGDGYNMLQLKIILDETCHLLMLEDQ